MLISHLKHFSQNNMADFTIIKAIVDKHGKQSSTLLLEEWLVRQEVDNMIAFSCLPTEILERYALADTMWLTVEFVHMETWMDHKDIRRLLNDYTVSEIITWKPIEVCKHKELTYFTPWSVL